MYQRPPSAPRTSAIASSCLLPTPSASPYAGSQQNGANADRPSAGTPTLQTAARRGLILTPTASDARRSSDAGGRGGGPSLTQAMLPTPTASDAHRASSVYMRGNPTLAGAARLLPTPTAADANGVKQYARGNPSLMTALLPTPTAMDCRGSGSSAANPSPTLTDVTRRLLPTPTCSDVNAPATNPSPRATTSGGPPKRLRDEVRLLPTPMTRDCRSGGASTTTMTKNARPLNEIVAQGDARLRLSPEFVEAMMGLPLGWTCIRGLPASPPPSPDPTGSTSTGPTGSTRSATRSSRAPRRLPGASSGTA